MKNEELKVKNAIWIIVRRLGFRGVTSAIYHSSLVIRHLSFSKYGASLWAERVIRHSTRSQFSLFAKEICYLSLVISHFFIFAAAIKLQFS